MTHPPDDQPTIWLRQVPKESCEGSAAVWATRLIPGHKATQKKMRRPSPADLGPNDRIEDSERIH